MPTPAPASSAPSPLATPHRLHPELECGLGQWDKLLYGNHRIVVTAAALPPGCRAATATLPWRRQDANPENVDVIVVSAATGERVRNVVAGDRDREQGHLHL